MSTTSLGPPAASTPSLVRRHPVLSFVVLTYAVAWLLWAPLVIFPDRLPGQLALVLVLLGSFVPSACVHSSDAYSVPGSDCSGTWPLLRSRYPPYAPSG
jgi:hypothetical protein